MQQLLTDRFISKYEGVKPPMTKLGEFVFYRTYSRWLESEKRRETWLEVVRRAVEYNVGLEVKHMEKEGREVKWEVLRREAEELFDSIFNLRQFLSGRTFWVGGTEVAEKYPLANFNCAFDVVDNFGAIKDLFYLLMVGTGVGVRALISDVEKLPAVRQSTEIEYLYTPVEKSDRRDETVLRLYGETAHIIVGDSKEGWVNSLSIYLDILTSKYGNCIRKIMIDFSHVRPKGERLKTFGGTASGHESLQRMFEKIDKVVKGTLTGEESYQHGGKFRPIHVIDICNIIGENVVVGGVRRTSEICLISPNDEESINAKKDIFNKPNLTHRFMSNNSVFYEEKPSRDMLDRQMGLIRYNGEPAFINAQSARLRRLDFEGVNPCGEILLKRKQTCNLTTINVMKFAEDRNLTKLLDVQRASVRAGMRMTLVNLELPEWDRAQKDDRLIGCSLTGWQDMVGAIGLDEEGDNRLKVMLERVADEECEAYASILGINKPTLATTVKPEGTLSQLPTVSSGVHFSHSPYYIRRVRITAHDPLCQTAEELGWKMFAEVGQEWESANTKVIEFPIKSTAKRTKYDVSAIEQLNIYKDFQENYTQHNSSNTVTVKNDEWEGVTEWIWENWEHFIGITFLSLDDNKYELAPYEAIDQEEYEQRVAEMEDFDENILSYYELVKGAQESLDVGSDGCDAGSCPIR